MTAPKSISKRRGWREWLFGAADAQTMARVPAQATPADLPEQIGRYQILRKLGQGGMGVVYAARDERLGRMLAIKTVRVGDDETARRRFWREARAAASVNHPHICQLYEIGEDAGAPFIAMELLEHAEAGSREARAAFDSAGGGWLLGL